MEMTNLILLLEGNIKRQMRLLNIKKKCLKKYNYLKKLSRIIEFINREET